MEMNRIKWPRAAAYVRLSVSYHRAILNRWLGRWQGQVRGTVLDVGGERSNLDVYEFRADPDVRRWLYLNISAAKSPDLVADGAHMPLSRASVDTAVCLETLEHVPDPVAVVREVSRVLRIGGFLVLSVPFLGPIHSAPQDFWRFTEYQVKRMLEGAGLQIVNMDPLGGFLTVLCEMTKHGISNVRSRVLRWALGLLFLPGAAVLLRLESRIWDRRSSFPKMGTFLQRYTTGYAVLAVKPQVCPTGGGTGGVAGSRWVRGSRSHRFLTASPGRP